MLRLEAIDETVPVYRGRIRIEREITFGQEAALKPLIDASGELVVKGACASLAAMSPVRFTAHS